MKNREIPQHNSRIKSLFEKIRSIEDAKMQAEWSKYLCVLTSGFIEQSICSIFSSYADTRANSHIANYVRNQLNYFQNPDTNKIISLAKKFNKSWSDKIELLFENEDKYKTSINSVVGNKNGIAHGKSVSVTFVRIKEWYEDVYKFIEEMEKIIK